MKFVISAFLGLTFFYQQQAWSAALAGVRFECRDQQDASLDATLLKSPKYGIIAILGDGYDTTQLSQPAANGTVWMICHAEGADLVCPGQWQFGKLSTEARFSENASGAISVRFTRDCLHGQKPVTLPCSSQK